ncbi:hypothetical protein LOAG_12905 [Loa loa]|uniref:Uncharacterized protein n=1 Tax=Loa loa TaxID=7209 RepID=A0A1S0TKD7_LOALO|nr:hypothetical protein LOAG_12905 [Loa loa]EFO15603.1 hypothetical protein LOAG_12905 [Loa loa]
MARQHIHLAFSGWYCYYGRARAEVASDIEAAAILSLLGYQTAYEQQFKLQNRPSYRKLARD